MTEPLHCPFCKTTSGVNVQEVDTGVWAVCCATCGCIGPHFRPEQNIVGTDRTHAVNCWNAAHQPERALGYTVETIIL
jgi:ribosomal protein L37AE/L43A